MLHFAHFFVFSRGSGVDLEFPADGDFPVRRYRSLALASVVAISWLIEQIE